MKYKSSNKYIPDSCVESPWPKFVDPLAPQEYTLALLSIIKLQKYNSDRKKSKKRRENEGEEGRNNSIMRERGGGREGGNGKETREYTLLLLCIIKLERQ